jgi:hypothetical protein
MELKGIEQGWKRSGKAVDIGSQMLMGEEKGSDRKHEHQPEHLRGRKSLGRRLQKNKCGPGQPPGPHCYRGRSERRFSLERKIAAQQHSQER